MSQKYPPDETWESMVFRIRHPELPPRTIREQENREYVRGEQPKRRRKKLAIRK